MAGRPTTCKHCQSPTTTRRVDKGFCSERCRFLDKVDPASLSEPDGCWIWRGARHGKGYGHFRTRGAIEKAHRIAYRLHCAEIPPGMEALHTCDNPPCVNPAHLFLGINADNLADRQSKWRQAHGESHARAKLTEADVLEIRRSGAPCTLLSERYGVSPTTIVSARNGDTWRWLPNANRLPKGRKIHRFTSA